MKLIIDYSTKDRTELTEQTLGALRDLDVHVNWNDGSVTERGRGMQHLHAGHMRPVPFCSRVTGGADAAIVFALSRALKNEAYTHVGLLENDVLLPSGWLDDVRRVFAAGESDGLAVGAVTSRTYEDRVLIQRDGYAVLHNAGAGHVVFTREAARIVLDHYRTGWWADNRAVFGQLSGLDIGKWGCFRGADAYTTADWHYDAVLAAHGLATLGDVPSRVQMIGQDPPLEEQGLKIADAPIEHLRDDKAFETFRHRTRCVREGLMRVGTITPWLRLQGMHVYFAHHLPNVGGVFNDRWKLKWSQGFGPLSYVSDGEGKLTVPALGPVGFVVSGGERGGKFRAVDRYSGYEVAPEILPEGPQIGAMTLPMPGGHHYREIEITAGVGVRLFAMQASMEQPWFPEIRFDYNTLPPVGD